MCLAKLIILNTCILVSKSLNIGSGFHHGFGKESRAITLQNGKIIFCQNYIFGQDTTLCKYFI